MKKHSFLTCLMAGLFAACSSDEANWFPSEKNGGLADGNDANGSVIQPVSVTDGPIADFFNSELPELHSSSDRLRNTRSFFYDPITFGGVPIEKNIVYVINSRQELEDVYQGEMELPEIDFEKYTLVIGQQLMPYQGFYVAQKVLMAEEDVLVLNLYARNEYEILPCAYQHLYFWGLYPKLAQKTITVNAYKEYTKSPDK